MQRPRSTSAMPQRAAPRGSKSSLIPPWAVLGTHTEAVARRLATLQQSNFIERLWKKDPTLWMKDPSDAKLASAISERLGWLSIIEPMQQEAPALIAFAEQVRAEGYTHAALLGMGGSSLCPEVLRKTIGVRRGFLDLAVLDSTDPEAIRQIERRAPLRKTLFLVSTKSGGTVETLSFFRYFYERVRKQLGENAGANFIAITDPGTSLVALAAEHRFRRTYLNAPDIGGRYSALSFFGLVPAALMGIQIQTLLERAGDLLPLRSRHRYEADDRTAISDAIQLGAILGELALQGRNKLTLVAAREIAAFGAWAEQLIAESTGKQGKGILPVDGEPLGRPQVYADDRVFVDLRLRKSSDAGASRALAALERADRPVLHLELADKLDLGREFFRWEIATATAASILEINAFDEPNVQESKDNTNRILAALSGGAPLRTEAPAAEEPGVQVFGEPRPTAAPVTRGQRAGARRAVDAMLASFIDQVRPPAYIAILAYIAPTPARHRILQRIRTLLRDRSRAATTLGYGPRYLHSTGQFHKGGPQEGCFLEITSQSRGDLRIPSAPYTFGTLEHAQAQGDYEALQRRRRPVLRIDLERAETGLKRLLAAVQRVSRNRPEAS